MMWIIFLIISIAVLLGSITVAILKGKSKYKNGSFFDPPKILFIGVILSSVLLFIPIYYRNFETSDCGILETILISVHNMIRLFIVDGEFEFVTESLDGIPLNIHKCYTVMLSILFVLAPLLTFGFVLSFFKNIYAYKSYITHFNSDAYIFSELNDKSLALAKSLSNNKKRMIVFTSVFDESSERYGDLIEKSKEIGAICFKNDIITIDFSAHSSRKTLSFFAIGENQAVNISNSLKIIEKLKYRANTNLYVFSTQVESEILLANAFECGKDGQPILLKVRRVNEVQSLINRNLYENGFEKIFFGAYQDENGMKKINAVVVGMGQHGIEMTKALTWFCQMDGYDIEINSFDKDENAEQKFISICPELMAFSGKTDIPGESKYSVFVHPGLDVDTATFDNAIKKLQRPTYVLVALGDDEKNIATAVKLRAMFERMKYSPVIQAVVYNTEMKDALADVKNFKGMPYNIDFIGDTDTSYSEKVILASDLEEKALERHTKWGEEIDFWRYDYNYKSSVASAIHRKMKILCGVPGIDKAPKDRTEEELWNLRILEHRRWNAYMRSEGYVYGGTVDKSGRNDLAKTHNCLVPFDELPLAEQEKDDD